MNLLIFLDLTYNPGNAFLILPITQGGGAHVYLLSIGSCPPSLQTRAKEMFNCHQFPPQISNT